MSIGPRSWVVVVSVRPDLEKNLYFPFPDPRTKGTTCATGAPAAPAGAPAVVAPATPVVGVLVPAAILPTPCSGEETGDAGGHGLPVAPGLDVDELKDALQDDVVQREGQKLDESDMHAHPSILSSTSAPSWRAPCQGSS